MWSFWVIFSVNVTQYTQWLTCITTSPCDGTANVSWRSISQVCTWVQVAPRLPRLSAISGQSTSFYNGWPKLLAVLVWQLIPSTYPLGQRWFGHHSTVKTRNSMKFFELHSRYRKSSEKIHLLQVNSWNEKCHVIYLWVVGAEGIKKNLEALFLVKAHLSTRKL